MTQATASLLLYAVHSGHDSASKDPESQSIPFFNELQRFIPMLIENIVEKSRNRRRLECRTGRIQTGDERTDSN
jgi:hypothetical protein